MNNASGTTAKKSHMQATKLLWNESKNVVVSKPEGVDSSCGLHVQDAERLNAFFLIYKSNPDSCCVKCIEKMKQLQKRARQISDRNK